MAKAPTFKSLREAAEAGYHGKAVNIEGKGLQKVAFADKAYDRRMAERSAQAGRSVEDIARTASAAIDRAEGKPATRPQQNPRRVPGPNEGTATSVKTPSVRSEPLSPSVPASVRRAIEDAPPEDRRRATRIAEEGSRKRVPGRAIAQAIRNFFRGEGPTDPTLVMREDRNTGMAKGGMAKKKGYAKGGMVKNGNTDRRGKGMFYDSKSPRGYK
jgi:hypothetical protein